MLCAPHFTEVAAHPNWTPQSVRLGSPFLHKNTRLIPEHPHKSLFCAINSAWCSRLFFPQVMLHLLCLLKACLLSFRYLCVHKSLHNINIYVYTVYIFIYTHTYNVIYMCISTVGRYKIMAFCQSNVCASQLSSKVDAWNVLLLGVCLVVLQLELNFRSFEVRPSIVL